MRDLEETSLFGVKVHRLTMEQAVAAVEAFLQDGKIHQVVTADTSMLVMAQKDPQLRAIINGADLVTPDSFGVTWAARRLGRFLPERVTGCDLMGRICECSAAKGYPVFLLGAAPGVADEAALRLQQSYPGLKVAGTQHGFFQPAEEAAIVAKVAASGAVVLFVALGIPRQEKWIARHLKDTGARLGIGVGGSFDVYSGRVKRAPLWVQRCNLEWLYRLYKNPRKIHKVKTLPVLVWMTLVAMVRSRGKQSECGV